MADKIKFGKTHAVKCWVQAYQAIVDGVKTFEYRLNDRDYHITDIICLREWNHEISEFTGREFYVEITYILFGGDDGLFGIPPGYCVMSVVPVENPIPFEIVCKVLDKYNEWDNTRWTMRRVAEYKEHLQQQEVVLL